MTGAIDWADEAPLTGHQSGGITFVQRNQGYIDYGVIVMVAIGLLPPGCTI